MTDKTLPYSAVVVTGAGGWLGKNLLRALLHGLPECADLPAPPFAGLPLHAADTADIPFSDARLTTHRTDITSAEQCRKLFDRCGKNALVLHCAGLIHPRKIADLYAVNVQGTVNLFAAARAAAAARVVALSSNSPCGCNARPHERFTEQSPYRPYMRYGDSKMRMEQTVRALPPDTPPEWTLIRAPWFYGPLQPPRQSLFFSMIKNGKGPLVGGGENRRSMAYTDNLAQGIIRAALAPAAAGQIYWIADEEPYSMIEIIDTIERLLEEEFNIPCKRRRLRLPGAAAEIAFCCDWLLQRAGLYHQKIHVLSEMNKTIACDIGKAKRELGYAPAITLEEGMRRSISDVLARGGVI